MFSYEKPDTSTIPGTPAYIERQRKAADALLEAQKEEIETRVELDTINDEVRDRVAGTQSSGSSDVANAFTGMGFAKKVEALQKYRAQEDLEKIRKRLASEKAAETAAVTQTEPQVLADTKDSSISESVSESESEEPTA